MENQVINQQTKSVAEKTKQQSFSEIISSPAWMKSIRNNLQDEKKTLTFIAEITSAVNNNQQLAKCTALSIVKGGLLATNLNLPLDSSLGRAYLVPFKDNAVFTIGYKGYLQLAIQSGCYQAINTIEVKEGELVSIDPFTEEYKFNPILDDEMRVTKKTIGYYAMFRTLNGMVKQMYWSKAKMEQHAKQYSEAYKNDLKKGWSMSFWTKSFDEMAKKTMLRQLISKWGILSTEMIMAYKHDMSYENNGVLVYPDNPRERDDVFEKIEVNANTGEVLTFEESKKEEVVTEVKEDVTPY